MDDPTPEAAPSPPVGHRVAAVSRWPWLPLHRSGTLARHPYCAECGLVKAVGDARGLDQGGLMNLLARLERALERGGRRVTEAQTRLIAQRLKAVGADDAFALSRTGQVHLFSQIVSAHLGLGTDVVASYLRSC